MSNRRRISYCIALFTLFAVATTDSAAQVDDGSAQVRVPSLNGHRFIPSETVRDPFVNTYMLSQLGGGIATDLVLPLIEIDGDTLFLPSGDQLFVVLQYQYQQRIKKWLAVNVGFSTLGRLGTDAGALLLAGVTAATDLRLEWLFNVMRNDRSALSFNLGFRNASTTVVDLFGFVEDVIDGVDSKLVDTIPSSQAIAGARYAYGFSSLVGVKISGTIFYGSKSKLRDPDNEVNFEFGGGVSLDPRKRFGIPVGVIVSYAFRTLSLGRDDSGSDSQEYELKFDYTKPNDFSFGPAITLKRFPGISGGSESSLNVTLTSRYYF